ncbi:MAG: thioredoxin family protein [Candidatus Heimdallarchaeota archaeon]
MGELSKLQFFQPTKATWETSRDEDRPIILIFKEELCSTCEAFERDILSVPSIQSVLNTQYIPVQIDVHRFPELYERFADNRGWTHPIHCASHGEFIGYCNEKSPRVILRSLESLKKQLSRDMNPRLELDGQVSYNLPGRNSAKLDPEIFELIAETTLSFLLERYDKKDGGWKEPGGTKHHFSSAIEFLLLLYHRSRDGSLLNLVLDLYNTTVKGLQDPKENGFYQAATSNWQPLDKRKTLENNIAISQNIFHTYQLTGDLRILKTVEKTFSFMKKSLWDKSAGMFRYGATTEKPYSFYDPKGNCDVACLILDTNEIFLREFGESTNLAYMESIVRILNSHETEYGIPHNILNPCENQYLLRDQAAYLNLLLRLYSNTGRYLDRVIHMTEMVTSHYLDSKNFLFNDRASFPSFEFQPLSKALYRIQDTTALVRNLTILSHITGESKWREMAKRCIASYSAYLDVSREVPFPPEFVISLYHLIESPIEVLIFGKPNNSVVQGILAEAKMIYEPFKIIQLLNPETDSHLIKKRIPEAQLFPRPVAYIKIDNMLSPPAFTPKDIQAMLHSLLQAIEMNS